jgi:pimeloyl-ACP methyl ester carboxylesterase
MPRLVLLPGLDGTGNLFADILPFLTGFDVTVVRYPADRVLEEAEFLAHIRTHLPNAPFFLLAESFSTPFAIQLAAEQPQNLNALILSVGYASGPANFLERALLAVIAPIAVEFRLSAIAARIFLVGINAPKSLVRSVQNAVSSVAGKVLLRRLRQAVSCDVRSALPKINVPVLYLRAKQDRLIAARSGEEIRRLAPRVRIVEFDAPHTLLHAKPRECAAAVSAFISSIQPSAEPAGHMPSSNRAPSLDKVNL